ncbi:MAG: uroporphyrinogen decarboxylase/cobalamine-independent methonine synthase family protein [Armatimonadota bacterium]
MMAYTSAQALSLKPDWAEARERLTAWWRGEIVDRVCLGITCYPVDPGLVSPTLDLSALTPEEYFLNAEVRLAQIEYSVANTGWYGEAFPNASLDLGPGSLALYLGSTPGYSWETVWFHPWPAAAEGALPEYDEHNPIWVRHQQMLQQLATAAKGRYLPDIPDLVEGLDIVSSLRGNDELLFDLVDNPEWVHACQERLVDLYFRYYDRCYDICKGEDGSVSFTAFMVWAPGRMAKLQCDFSAMISPEMYAEFQLPYLRRICQGLDYSVYHWDGPTALPHLDNLLAIPELNAIQWTPGAGANEVWHEEWYPYYKRALDGGKSLLLMGSYNPDGMERLVKTFGPQGLYLYAWGAPSPADAEALLARAARNWR